MLEQYKIYTYKNMAQPYVTAGDRAYLIGTQDGLFPDMGMGIPGEMGGLWVGDLKICDGFYLAVDDVPLQSCEAFCLHPIKTQFHYRLSEQQLHVMRTQFIPDGVCGVVIDVTLENLRDTPRMAEVSFTVRTDIMTAAAARGECEMGRDVGEYDPRCKAFFARDTRNPWHAAWGAQESQSVLLNDLTREVYGFGNTQGKGVNGRLFYRVRLGARQTATLRLLIAGDKAARSRAEETLETLRRDAQRLYAEKEARVERLLENARATLPDREIERAFNWARFNYEWLMRALPRGGRAFSMNLPERPMLFGEAGEEALSGVLPLGGIETAEGSLRVLRDASMRDLGAGRVAQSVSLSGNAGAAGGPTRSAQFVALVWRTFEWSGNTAFLEEMLPFLGQCMNYLLRTTRSFTHTEQGENAALRQACLAYDALLGALALERGAWAAYAEQLPETADVLYEGMPLYQQAEYHGRRAQVEQMIGCVQRLSETVGIGMPGAMRDESAAPGVFLQSRAAGGILWPVTRYLFGVHPDAQHKRIYFSPHTPIGWNGWKLEGLRIGDARFDISSERATLGTARYTLRSSAPGWTVVTGAGESQCAYALDGALTLTLED